MDGTVAIVGGGFSGLVSAFLLERGVPRAPQTIVLEGSERLGGRIRSGTLGPDRIPYDAGAAELYDITESPQLRHLVDLLGLPTRALRATPIFFFEGLRLESDDDFREAFGDDAMERLEAFWETGTAARPPEDYARAGQPADNHHPWADRSFRDVLRSIGHPVVERFTEVQVHSDLATSPDNTSGTFGFDNLLIDDPRYCAMYTIVGGNERLVRRLAHAVRGEKRLQAPVTSLAPRADGRYDVAVADDETITVDAVLLTLPPPCLLEIAYLDDGLRTAMERHVAHHDHMTAYLRVTFLFDRRCWADDLPEDYWVSDAFGGVTVYDQSPARNGSGGPGILSCLIAGDAARQLAGWPDGEVIASVLATLPRSVRAGGAPARDTRVDRWTGRLGVSALPGGDPLLPLRERHRPSAAHPGVIVVGDYLYDATISGALDGCGHGLELLLEGLGADGTACVTEIMARAGLTDAPFDDEPRERESQLPFLRIGACAAGHATPSADEGD